ncbi:DNA adenine methylase [Agarivorans sp. QJM3NY_29]|uniref:DNA adenine methylase n=1 Tax=unclassified Agarivorans TaxID=2636026 RepID=UPI003D7E794E
MNNINEKKVKNKHKTIQYMGNKKELLTFLDSSLQDFLINVAKDNNCKSFFDAFSGSGQVANYFKDQFEVTTNDKQAFTKVINDAFLCSKASKERIAELIERMNNIPDFYFNQTDGWFTKTYSRELEDSPVDSDGNRKVWLTKNAKRIDIYRHILEVWLQAGKIDQDEKNILMVSLILAVNSISNVMGHQNGYLKDWSAKSQKDILLETPEFESNHTFNHKNFQGDVFETLRKVSADITYFDPPYGTNNEKVSCSVRYSSFYHLWNTIVENSRPEIFGRASKPTKTKGFTEPLEQNKKESVMPLFVRMIEESKSKYVSFSYSNKSLLTAEDFEEVFRLAGCDMDTFRIYYTNHKTNSQAKSAMKSGDFIARKNDKEELFEFFIIAKKKSCLSLIDLNIEKTKKEKAIRWISTTPSDYSIKDKVYGFFYDKTENMFVQNICQLNNAA